MANYIDAGKLNQPVQVLELRETAPGVWEWAPARRTWASITLQPKTNLFSKVGIGARDAAVVVRRQPLTLHHVLRWGDTHLFLTSIVPMGRNHLEVDAAAVETVACTAVRTEDTVGENGRPVHGETMRVTFPAVLTEKYVRYEREDTHAESEAAYVLVTGKPIELKEGDLVTVREGPARGTYHVQAAHRLDPYKSEYEIAWRGDV